MYSGERSNLLCKDGEVCAYFEFFGTSTEYHEIGEPSKLMLTIKLSNNANT